MPINQREFNCIKLKTEEIFLAVSPEHRLATRNRIKLEEVSDDLFISLTTEYGLRDITNEFCQEAGFKPKVAFEINSLEVIETLVMAELGIAFIPAYWKKENNNSSPVNLHIDSPVCERTIWISWVKDRYMSNSVEKFIEFAVEYFTNPDLM